MNRIDNETASRTPAGREVQANPAFDLRDVAQMENTFITLMSAQIQNQDPTNPADSSQYINQYANLAQVRSMANLTRVAQAAWCWWTTCRPSPPPGWWASRSRSPATA